jgi:hypothetical protein
LLDVKRREQNLPTYPLFIDYEKAFDSLNRDRIWKILAEEKIPPHLIEAIKSLYKKIGILIKYMNDQISEPNTTNHGARDKDAGGAGQMESN